MLRSENTLAHAFLSLFSEQIIHISQLFTVILIHLFQVTLGPGYLSRDF